MEKKREHTAVWFEIPAADLKRAAAFYEKVLGVQLKPETVGEERLAVFPHPKGSVSGCVMENAKAAGANGGIMVYLNCDGFLNEAVARVPQAGGKLRGPIVELPMGMGSFIHIEDTEGNRIGLHTAV